MEATIKIDGRDVRFKATAAVPLLYRRKFNRDVFRDLQAAASRKDGESGEDSVAVIERLAYVMAYHADPAAVPDSLEAWMAEFSPLAVYLSIPVIKALWAGNTARLEEAKKKLER